ncbi:MAG: nonstructural protein [Microvirus sp.]|nr:MAG: nonstructural protein [Microvirus sp.]
MKHLIFCVKDRATDVFGTPFFLLTNNQAIRSFSDEVNRVAPDNQLNRHPDDFDLYEVGSFDSDSGVFSCETPVVLVRAKDLITVTEMN